MATVNDPPEYGSKRWAQQTLFRARRRSMVRRMEEPTITVDDILDLWSKTGGRCPVTGFLFSPGSPRACLTSATLDRIDDSVGYHPGNVQIVSAAANVRKKRLPYKRRDAISGII